jgi:uncharacterized membrane-anchored protein
MQAMNVPRLGPLYWATISLASVFGTNTGDIMSHTLRLGDYKGLPVLVLMFAGIMVAEQRARVARTLYYWLAIIVLRTAATNLADLSTLQLELDYETVIVGLAVLLILIRLAGRLLPARDGRDLLPSGIPSTDAVYWLAMLTAATLGTALGDYGSHTLTLHVSVVVSVTLLAAALWLVRRATSDTALYWCAIVIVRAAGTNVGDLLAFKKGLNLGLPVSSLLTGALFFGFVLWGNRRGRRAERLIARP